jgi:hypothetical protein
MEKRDILRDRIIKRRKKLILRQFKNLTKVYFIENEFL